MKSFQKISQGEIAPALLNDVLRHPEVWQDTDVILLRTESTDGIVDRPTMKTVPRFKQVALALMGILGATQLGEMYVERIAPGGSTPMEASNDLVFSHYIFVLCGAPGTLFLCGDETVSMSTGEIWWYDATLEHMQKNNSQDDQVHLHISLRIEP